MCKIAASCRRETALWPHLPVIFHRRNRKKEIPWSAKSMSLEQVHLHLHTLLKRIGWRFKSFLKKLYLTLSITASTRVNQLFFLAAISICWHSFFRCGIIRVKLKLNLIEKMGQAQDCSAAAILFSFRNRANFHSQFSLICYHNVFDLVPVQAPCHFFCVFWLFLPVI